MCSIQLQLRRAALVRRLSETDDTFLRRSRLLLPPFRKSAVRHFGLALGLFALALQPAVGAEPQLSFEADIRPILRAHCFDCHGAESEKEGKLDLRLVRFQKAGGESGPAIVPGDPAGSLIWQRI